MLIYSCVIYALRCYSLFHLRFATYTLLLCCALLITPLVETQRDAVIQPRYTFTVGPAATYILSPCGSCLITALVNTAAWS